MREKKTETKDKKTNQNIYENKIESTSNPTTTTKRTSKRRTTTKSSRKRILCAEGCVSFATGVVAIELFVEYFINNYNKK